MYQFSRAIYRELAPQILAPPPGARASSQPRARAARLRGGRSRAWRPIATTSRTRAHAVLRHSQLLPDERAGARLPGRHPLHRLRPALPRREPGRGYTAVSGEPPQCRATTRKGSACQRVPLPHNGYCPSHQHLAETEDRELAAPEPLRRESPRRGSGPRRRGLPPSASTSGSRVRSADAPRRRCRRDVHRRGARRRRRRAAHRQGPDDAGRPVASACSTLSAGARARGRVAARRWSASRTA